jgi:molybdopterin converting factor small subunit
MKPVLFFGRLSTLEASGPASPTDSETFREKLALRFPELAGGRIRMVVNRVLVVSRTPVGPDDEIAFLPPMSGG